MSHLLKKVLKSMCGANHWSYAVFWKIGFQNPKLLIWEECYYEVKPCSDLLYNSNSYKQHLTLEELERCWVTPGTLGSQFGAQVGDKVQWLVNKMMVANQVHVIGEGLVGRTAFTGNHQWIVSGNYNGNGHPPEVVNEIHVQFSAGMQTVAVIPVIPLGVVQLGSSLAIMENIGFIQNVKDLICQLDCIPSALLPDNCVTEESVEYIGMPVTEIASVSLDPIGNMKKLNSSSLFAGGMESFPETGFVNHSSQSLFGGIEDNQKTSAPTSDVCDQNASKSHGDSSCESVENAIFSSNLPLKRQLENKFAWADAISVESDLILNQQTSLVRPGSGSYCRDYMKNPAVLDACQGGDVDQSSVSHSNVMTSQPNATKMKYCDSSGSCKSTGTEFHIGSSSNIMVDGGLPYVANELVTSGVLSGCLYSEAMGCKPEHASVKKEEQDLYEVVNMASSLQSGDFISNFNKIHDASQLSPCTNTFIEDFSIQSSRGDDLFDILGMEFKNKVLNGYACNFNGKPGPDTMDQLKGKLQNLSFLNTNGHRMSESGNFSLSGSDLLESVVSGIQPASTHNSDDNVSCGTAPNNSPKFGSVNISNQICELSGHSKLAPRCFEVGSTFIRSAFGKKGSGNSPQTSSFYGSQISSLVEQGPISECETSIATANSKKADLVGKPGRKRLKHGENPRPRPKDRQMIQDRVKELREIIPNGAKYSIDALLERTIKHMLFLQSVTKHADILKRMADSKIINKDGGLLLKDNFEGGATWAYEVGSQSMICPIVVEDLNPPRQFVVEMLCEEKGFFLEVADMIRGMGIVILKGVMEARNDKIWAHFAVEANRDVTRMEIFISLVHLLEPTPTSSAQAERDRLVHPVAFDRGASVTGNKQQLLSTVSSDVLRAKAKTQKLLALP